MKKGVLLTLGMLLFSSLVLSLGILIFHNTQGTEDRFAEMGLYDRLYNIDTSLQKGMQEIFVKNSGVSLNKLNDTITISEYLPGSTKFETEIDAYIAYLEKQYSSYPNVSLDATILNTLKNELPFTILPHNILIDHTTFPTGNLEITPSSANLESYNLTISSTRSSVVFADSITAGTFEVIVKVTTNAGTNTQTYNIDETAANTITLTFDSGLPSEADVVITINDPAHLLIDRNGVAAVYTVEMELTHQAEELVRIYWPEDLFRINFPTENLTKSGTVRIL